MTEVYKGTSHQSDVMGEVSIHVYYYSKLLRLPLQQAAAYGSCSMQTFQTKTWTIITREVNGARRMAQLGMQQQQTYLRSLNASRAPHQPLYLWLVITWPASQSCCVPSFSS